MSRIADVKATIALIIVFIALITGCSDPNTKNTVDPDTGKHNVDGWANPDTHGGWAKQPSSEGGLASCQGCHGSDFSGGISQTACSSCHGVSAPHPASWTTGARKHSSTDQINAAVCAVCHTSGANSPVQPTSPAPSGTAPGCFNNTLCHDQNIGHAPGWASPDAHGYSAKSQANGFSQCKACHGSMFSGAGTAPTCLNTAGCHGAGVASPHPALPWVYTSPSVTRTHTTTNTGNASVCADCHTNGANLTSLPTPTPAPAPGTPAGCFNNTLCHAQLGHAAGWASPAAHGAAAKSAPNVSNVTGFSTCQTCHGTNFAGGTAQTCLNAACHGAASPHAAAPWISSVSSTMTHTTTDTQNAAECGLCHLNNRQPPSYATLGQAVGCLDGTLCHTASVGCVNCHASIVSAPTASLVSGGTVTRRDAVVGEFGLAWGHKKSGRGAVADTDCIVCHLEGDFGTQTRSAKHKDGYIDLRDPDGAGETAITNISGGAFTFTKFTTSYAAGSRTSTGHLSNNIDNVLTQKFCLTCHDSNGATNTTARTTHGSPTAAMPFGGVALGANYTAANGAIGTQGLVDVKTQFATTNSSYHPVLGPLNKDYPTASRLNNPYKPTGTRGTSGAQTNSIVLNCFDCHNVVGTPLTTRTISAHGNAATIRGTATVSGTPSSTNYPTLCRVCHVGYETSNANNAHDGSAYANTSAFGTGSGVDSGMNPYMQYGCNVCHSSGYATAVVRPIRAQDVHGFNGNWTYTGYTNNKQYAFMRNTVALRSHTPRVGGSTTALTCVGMVCAGSTSIRTEVYTPGGTY